MSGTTPFANVFPNGRASDWLYQGWFEWLKGHPSRAYKLWHISVAAAHKQNMPYEEIMAHYELARHLDPARPTHLEQIRNIGLRLDAKYYLQQLKTLA